MNHPRGFQRYLEIAFGIVAPIVCVIADPCVFRNRGWFDGAWIPYPMAAYVFIALEIAALAAWMFLPRKGPLVTLALAGSLFAGALASAGLGLRMLPLTVSGLIFLIGFLGFTPFLTALVFHLNARRAWRSIPETDRSRATREIAVLFAFLPMILAIGAEWAARYSMNRLIGQPESQESRKLARWLGSTRTDDVVLAWETEKDPDRKHKLAKLYRQLTGEDVEARLDRLRD
jgi:hypothetical protein